MFLITFLLYTIIRNNQRLSHNYIYFLVLLSHFYVKLTQIKRTGGGSKFKRLVFPKLLLRTLLYFHACPNFLLNMKKAFTLKRKGYKSDIGRSGGIRTHDLFHPKEALYQAEPRPESQGVLYRFIWILSTLFYKLF